jgi:hypothetical protein
MIKKRDVAPQKPNKEANEEEARKGRADKKSTMSVLDIVN